MGGLVPWKRPGEDVVGACSLALVLMIGRGAAGTAIGAPARVPNDLTAMTGGTASMQSAHRLGLQWTQAGDGRRRRSCLLPSHQARFVETAVEHRAVVSGRTFIRNRSEVASQRFTRWWRGGLVAFQDRSHSNELAWGSFISSAMHVFSALPLSALQRRPRLSFVPYVLEVRGLCCGIRTFSRWKQGIGPQWRLLSRSERHKPTRLFFA